MAMDLTLEKKKTICDYKGKNEKATQDQIAEHFCTFTIFPSEISPMLQFCCMWCDYTIQKLPDRQTYLNSGHLDKRSLSVRTVCSVCTGYNVCTVCEVCLQLVVEDGVYWDCILVRTYSSSTTTKLPFISPGIKVYAWHFNVPSLIHIHQCDSSRIPPIVLQANSG